MTSAIIKGENKISTRLIESLMNHILSYFSERKEIINKINVFPVPDGDTGTNMELTIKGALEHVKGIMNKRQISSNEYIKELAEGMILNSRGCSGAILSLYFKGIVSKLDLDNITNKIIIKALQSGYKSAYDGTINPQEGTMLTLMKELYLKYREVAEKQSDPFLIMKEVMLHLKAVLDRTPEMLPILSEAGVIDSGALGFYTILEGILDFFGISIKAGLVEESYGKKIYRKILDYLEINKSYELIKFSVNKVLYYLEPQKALFALKGILRFVIKKKKNNAWNREINYRYCTEFLLMPKEKDLDLTRVRLMLNPFGDEIFTIKSNDMIKVHIHTNQPKKVLEIVENVGTIGSIKVDDMKRQQRVLLSEIISNNVKYSTDNAILFIVDGKGFEEIINSFGYPDVFTLAYENVKPSVLDMMKKVESIGARNLIIAADDKDILMTLKLIASIYSYKYNIIVTHNDIVSLLHALYNYDENEDFQDKIKIFNEEVKFFKVARAERTIKNSVNEGEYFVIYNNRIISHSTKIEKVIQEAILKIKEDETLITLYSGKMEKEDEEVLSYLKARIKDVDFELYYGGQNRYNYYVVFE